MTGNVCVRREPHGHRSDRTVHNVAPQCGDNVIARKFNHHRPKVEGGPKQNAASCAAVDARQSRLLAFIDSCEPRVEELLNEALQAGGDPADCIALLSDGTVLPRYINLVAPVGSGGSSRCPAAKGPCAPFCMTSGTGPHRASYWRSYCFEKVQAVSMFSYSVMSDIGAQA